MQPIRQPVRCYRQRHSGAVAHLALVAVNENWVIPPVKDLNESGTDDVLGDVVEWFLS
jgi:hypothetical protein